MFRNIFGWRNRFLSRQLVFLKLELEFQVKRQKEEEGSVAKKNIIWYNKSIISFSLDVWLWRMCSSFTWRGENNNCVHISITLINVVPAFTYHPSITFFSSRTEIVKYLLPSNYIYIESMEIL